MTRAHLSVVEGLFNMDDNNKNKQAVKIELEFVPIRRQQDLQPFVEALYQIENAFEDIKNLKASFETKPATEEEEEKEVQQMEAQIEAQMNQYHFEKETRADDNADDGLVTLMTKVFIAENSVCMCNSGLLYKDCCGTE